jgi:hypothetical protein
MMMSKWNFKTSAGGEKIGRDHDTTSTFDKFSSRAKRNGKEKKGRGSGREKERKVMAIEKSNLTSPSPRLDHSRQNIWLLQSLFLHLSSGLAAFTWYKISQLYLTSVTR